MGSYTTLLPSLLAEDLAPLEHEYHHIVRRVGMGNIQNSYNNYFQLYYHHVFLQIYDLLICGLNPRTSNS